MRKILLAAAFALLLGVGAAGAQVVVRVAPPVPPREVMPLAPGPRYVWTGGYYRWSGRSYIWVPGHYVVPPPHHAVWVPGHWVYRHGGYVWAAGYWR